MPSRRATPPAPQAFTGEDRQAHPIVVQEGAEAGRPLAGAGDRELPGHQQQRHAKAQPIPESHVGLPADQRQRTQHAGVQHALGGQVHFAEQDRR